MESPLRKASFAHGDTSHLRDDVLDSEVDNVIHVDGRGKKSGSKVTGGGEKDNKLDFGPEIGNGAVIHEHPDGAPILASDELEKRPGSAFLQPAVSPEAERSDWLDDAGRSRRGSGTVDSHPSSRPGSMHGSGLSRFISQEERPGSGMGTPLEEIEEYEPLFPEDDDKNASPSKAFKGRPGLAQHHFPSNDVWEDTPASLQFTASVETPEPPQAEISSSAPPSSVFETPEQEQMRRNAGGGMNSDSKTFAKPHFKSGVQGEVERPGFQRFPSQDVWEDTPDSMRLETTVSGPQEPEIKSPVEERPTTTALASSQDDNNARATTGMTGLMRPHVPSRPARSSKLSQDITPQIAPEDSKQDLREREVPDLGAIKETSPTKTKAPGLPDRPKPTIPARPVRSPKLEESSQEQAPAPKQKPAVPARPANSKFANLKSGFMSDLASRIQLGPQGPPPKPKEAEPEAEENKAPLADARKSRAKGPQRRKPAASPSAAPITSTAQPLAFTFSTPVTVWHIDASEVLHVPSTAETPHPQDANLAEAEKTLEANAAANATEAAPAEPIESEKQPATISKPSPTDEPAVETEPVLNTQPAQVGSEGDEPTESISAPVQNESEEVRGTLEEALRGSEPAPQSAVEAQSKLQASEVADTAELNAKPSELGGVEGYTGAKDPEKQGSVALRDGEEVGRQQED